jgi:hypothetical protein
MTLQVTRNSSASHCPKTAKLQHAGRWPAEANTTALGFRANLGVADDLFGSREDTYSETVRNKNVGTGMTSLRIYRGSDYAVTADGGD